MADMHLAGSEPGQSASRNLATMANWLGAGVSLALLVGVGVWGYKLVVRDVSGVPVVRAIEGPMRIAPEKPGGRVSRNEGLAVNKVAGTSATTPPPDQLTLAPRPLDLTEEDEIPARIVAPKPLSPRESLSRVSLDLDGANGGNGLSDDPVQVLANQIAANAEPLGDITPAPGLLGADAPEKPEQLAQAQVAPGPKVIKVPQTATPQPKAIPASVPGVARSLRPALRPDGLKQSVLSAPVAAPATTREIDPATLEKGTRLVQFGAYDSPETARKEWARLEARFGEFLEGKDRVIERATSGGRVFYRLRAHGFADLSDSRRFCAAFVAEDADCIPVVAR